MSNDRCTGHCCESMTLSSSYEEMKELAHNYIENKKEYDDMEYSFQKEVFQVYTMIEKIDYDPGNGEYFTDRYKQRYRCVYHNKKTGDCMNYDNRPEMCKRHPSYGDITRVCMYKGCTHSMRANIDEITNRAKELMEMEYQRFAPYIPDHLRKWKNPTIKVRFNFFLNRKKGMITDLEQIKYPEAIECEAKNAMDSYLRE